MVGFSWVFGSMMVIICIVGLAMMESGYSRAKNASSVLMNAMIGICVAIPSFMLLGGMVAGIDESGAMMLESTLAAFVCCILAGGLMGRVKASGMLIISLMMSLVSYPISVRICKLLAENVAYQDFGGFGTVFVSGAFAAYIGSGILGSRTGKHTRGGATYVVPGHNIPLGLIGVFILSTGMLGMSGANGLLVALAESKLILLAQNLVIGGAVAGLVGLFFTYIRYKKPDVTMTASAMVAGFVAAIPGCDSVSLGVMAGIAAVTGFFTVLSIEGLERGAMIDDISGVISIFGLGGVIGLLGAGIFNNEAGLKALPGNIVAVFLIFMVQAVVIGFTELILKSLKLLRVPIEQEVEGTDLCQYGLVGSYNDFAMNLDTTDWSDLFVDAKSDGESVETEVHEPYVYDMSGENRVSLTKIEIICRKEKLETLKLAMNDIGIMGMTVSAVTGCGVQKGYNEFYRGVPLSVQLRAKVRVEIVVAKVPVENVVNTARRVLYTGHVGDGKIFIYSLNDVVRVRTGESGYAAMQGVLSE